jgi:hypothetical protein
LKPALQAQDGTMFDPGLNRHEWESEMASLEEDVHDDPGGALSELDDLVGRMLEETSYDVADPVVRDGEEREIVSEFIAAREIKEAYERGSDDLSPGDVAAAVNGYRAIFAYLVSSRSVADADITHSGEPEA